MAELTDLYVMLARRTPDELRVIQTFIQARLDAHENTIVPVEAGIWGRNSPKQIKEPPSRMQLIPSSLVLLYSSEGPFMRLCNGRHHECQFFTKELRALSEIDPKCLYLTGFTTRLTFEEYREDIIGVIGGSRESGSTSIFIQPKGRFGFIVFKDHDCAAEAQQNLQEWCIQNEILVNFADKTADYYKSYFCK